MITENALVDNVCTELCT